MARVLSATYDELVEKAQRVFWLNGYKGISAKELSEELGVSSSTIYTKYPKEMLFMDSLDYYTSTYSDPFLKGLRESTEGIKSLQEFFYALIEALLDRTFPKSCLMVNTIVEMRVENQDIIQKYHSYISKLSDSYKVVLRKAHKLGQIKDENRIDAYAEFLLGMIFSLSIFYKIQDKSELKKYVDEQLKLID
mgnify:CR=1 FL=1